jgi:hypothetical protein
MNIKAAMVMLSTVSFFQMTFSSEIHLSGVVLNEFDQPVSGASVSLYKRDSLSTRTDQYGKFELTEGSILSSINKKAENISFVTQNGSVLKFDLKPGSDAEVIIYDSKGSRVFRSPVIAGVNKNNTVRLPLADMASGVYLTVVNSREIKAVIRHVVCASRVHCVKPGVIKKGKIYPQQHSLEDGFRDILIVSAEGTQTVRQAITDSVQKEIKVKLMPIGVGHVTPGIPVFTDKGGEGDVTTYGSVSDPEFSQGGACNYGSTGIRYYAAINVNQFPGDLEGQWQGGQICGACARVLVRTRDGEIRSTIVRIMDKCPDDNCGIDLGGAPAGEIMKDQPGRYSGEWEWVSCDGAQGVSDGPPSLHVKEGSGKWWSLVQVRNGPGAVLEIRARKVIDGEWQIFPWATEAENFLSVPVEILQDSGEWELEVIWRTGVSGFLQVQGEMLGVEEASYELKL